MHTYEGTRTADGCQVTVNREHLDPRGDLWWHAPTAFAWDDGENGPAELALALLADALEDDGLAEKHCRQFTREVVAQFDRDRFLITQEAIRGWLEKTLSSPQEGN